MLINGRCHCGNIKFSLRWEPEPAQIPARACTCSFCAKHGGVWTSCPTGSLRVTVANPLLVSKYAFGTKTADFHVCSRCGVVPVVTSKIGGRVYAVVSVNAFEGFDAALLSRAQASFDGEGLDDRLSRRKRNWIPDVEFLASGT
ncbi:MAG TPA: hypothetical protein VKP89_02675 [Burkholderiales bacterium]|nr:hypothetical protein [Burkholderiales bacterium]